VAPVTEDGSTVSAERVDRLARDGLFALVGAGVTAVLNLVLVFVTIHAVGRTTAGIVFAATSAFLIAETAARLGCPTGLMYFLVRARTLGNVRELRAVLRAGLTPVVIVSTVLAVVVIAFADPIGEWMAKGHGQAAASSIKVLAVFIPIAAISDSLLNATRAFGTMRPLVLVERIGRPSVQTVLTLVLIGVIGREVVSAAWLSFGWGVPYVASGVIALLWTYRLVRRNERRARTGRGDAPTPWAPFWRFTSPRAMQSIVQIGLQRLGIVLVSAILGPAHAAVYAAVTRFLVFGQLGSQAITAAVQPQIGALMVKEDHEGAQHIYQVSTCWLVLMCWPFYLGLAVFSGQIPQIFGKGYDAGTGVLVVLAIAMLFATSAGMVDAVLAMAGKTTWTLMNATVALVVNVGLTLLLLPHLGILGAAIGWATGIVLNNVLPLTQLAVSMHLHPFGRGPVLAIASAAVWLGVVPVAAGLLFGFDLLPLVVGYLVGMAGYLATAWRLRGVFELDALLRATRRNRHHGAHARPAVPASARHA
jgi:O-antigen/teichoic acid export membrane protein